MKTIKILFIFALSIHFLQTNAQEKKIKFNKGTLKICSSKNFTIEGYDGDEVIIKSLHDKVYNYRNLNRIIQSNRDVNGKVIKPARTKLLTSRKKMKVFYENDKDSVAYRTFFSFSDSERKKGLKQLGKQNENSDLGIYFTIEEKEGELIFKDNVDGQLVMMSNENYEIKIPNSIKLNWQTNTCKEVEVEKSKYVFFNSKASSLSNFDGEVEISTSLNNMKLVDVTGPVSINSIGGNVTIEFDKLQPKKLYSIYSNNGFIDITLPESANVTVDAHSSSIFSDIDFNVLEDEEENGMQKMKLKLKKGNVKMKLNAGLGNIYLRKK